MNSVIKSKIEAILEDFVNTDDCLDNPYADFINPIVNRFKQIPEDCSENSLNAFNSYLKEIYEQLLEDESIPEDNPRIVYLYQILTAIYEHKLANNKAVETEEYTDSETESELESDETFESDSSEQFQWDIARQYFSANKDKIKLSKAEGLTKLSYIKVGNDIFVLAKKLGEGAFGRVKESQQDETEIEVMNQQGDQLVVKIIVSNPALNQKDEQRTINNEIAALKKLGEFKATTMREAHHGNPRKYYIVAKKHDGKNLLTLLESYELTEPQKLQIAYLCAKRLKEAHAKGLLHLDVKPENFIVKINISQDHQGNEEIQIEDVNLIDWGLTEEVSSTAHHVSIAHPKGTPGYMAPEIHHNKASPSSDIFSLGMMFINDLQLNNQTDLIHFDSFKRISLSQAMKRLMDELKTYSMTNTDDFIEKGIADHVDVQEKEDEPTKSETELSQDPFLQVIDILNETGTKRMSEVFEMDFEEQLVIFNWYKSVSEMRHLLENVKKVSKDEEIPHTQKLKDIKAFLKNYNRNTSKEWSIPSHEMQNIKSLLKMAFAIKTEVSSSGSDSSVASAHEASSSHSQDFLTPQETSPFATKEQTKQRIVTPGFDCFRANSSNTPDRDYKNELISLLNRSIYSSNDQYQEEINNLLDIVKKTKNTNNLQAKFYIKSIIEKHVRDLDQFITMTKNLTQGARPNELAINVNKVVQQIQKIQDALLKDLCNGNPQLPMKDAIIAKSKLYNLCEERKLQLNALVFSEKTLLKTRANLPLGCAG